MAHTRDECEKIEYMTTAYKCTGNANEWYIDSGASCHMTRIEIPLDKQKSTLDRNITGADDSKLKIIGIGDTRLKANGQSIDITDVMYTPKLAANLLSVHKIVCKGNTVIFNQDGCTIYDSNKQVVLNCKPTNGMYKISAESENCMLIKNKANSALLWHRRLGHINYQSLCKMRDGAVRGIEFNDDSSEIERCETCAMGKQCRQPFTKSEYESKNILDLIHSDLVGPMETLSIGKSRYILTFIDDHSRKIFSYFLRNKSDVYDTFLQFKNFVENQTERKIKILRTDNGGEYLPEKFDALIKKAGIQHQLTAPYTPQQNGVAERYNRTIVERAKCLLHDADLPKTYWA